MTQDPKIALITMTRDRITYSKHCFGTLQQNAGIDYDHFVLDQASEDGTVEWLLGWQRNHPQRHVTFSPQNIGICAAANQLLEKLDPENYDVIVRYDNDCEVTEPGTLRACAEAASEFGAIVSPRVLGLINTPPTIKTVSLGGQLLDATAILGGIFMAIPAFLFCEHGFRWNEWTPFASGDESIIPWWRVRGGLCGYLRDWEVHHYETSVGQKARYPEYEQRKIREMAA